MGRFGQVQEGLGLLLVFWLMAGPAQGRHPLPVLWLMPVGSRLGGENLTAGVAPAVRLALQDLKKQPPPLGNYEIQLQLLDSQVGLRPGMISCSYGGKTQQLFSQEDAPAPAFCSFFLL